MIFTLTLNPSLDYHVWVSSFREGTIHSVEKEWKDAGGKGINVSKVLKILGMESTALGFVGGFTGAFIRQQVEKAGVSHHLIQVEEDSRINLKLKAAAETDLSGVSPTIPQAALDQLWNQLADLSDGDYLVLAGSVPESVPADIYQKLIRQLAPKGVRICLDASGEALRNSLAEGPFLIKPNHHELGELFGTRIASAEEAVAYGRKAVESGAQNVIVSMAGEGAVFVNRSEAYRAIIPRQQPVNSIGAGDSLVAGFLYRYLQTNEFETAFRFAVAAGSATALSEGFCTQETVDSFLPQVRISIMA
jgi:1-phosphofructokinase